MKTDREDEQTLDFVSCLMLLSKDGQNYSSSPYKKQKTTSNRAFVCNTCNREFSSFQAHGSHRASHNKPKVVVNGATNLLQLAQSTLSLPVKPKTHDCPICGLEFAIGQALGGHMRRYMDVMSAAAADRVRAAAVLVLKKSNSSKRVSCLNLDLNFDPPPAIGLLSTSVISSTSTSVISE